MKIHVHPEMTKRYVHKDPPGLRVTCRDWRPHHEWVMLEIRSIATQSKVLMPGVDFDKDIQIKACRFCDAVLYKGKKYTSLDKVEFVRVSHNVGMRVTQPYWQMNRRELGL